MRWMGAWMGCALLAGGLAAQTMTPQQAEAQRRIAASRADEARREARVRAYEEQTRERQQRANAYIAAERADNARKLARVRAYEEQTRERQQRANAYIAAERADNARKLARVRAYEEQTRERQQRVNAYIAAERARARDQRAVQMQRRAPAYTGSADRTRYRRYDDQRNFYYRDNGQGLPPGLAKRDGDLPPGLAKRGGNLPPGLEKRR